MPNHVHLVRVTKTGSTDYSYDANGSRTAFGSARTYTYDAAGRLMTYTGSGHNARYQYNGLGERVAKTVDGVITYFVYDEQGHLIGEYDAAGTVARETVYLGDLPMLVLSGSTPYYIHADWRNTPRQLDNAQQQAVWAWDPPPFGGSTPNSNPQNLGTSFTWNARFPGQYWGYESGLFYNYQRTYDPTLGRHLESDPTGLSGGINPYSYASGDPISLVDPDGLLGRAPGRGPYPAGQGPGQSPAQFAENVKNAYLDYRQANLERFAATLDAAEGGDPEAAIQLGLGFVGGFACTTNTAKSILEAKGLPDSALVCRGGLCTADRFAGGSGVKLDAAGKMSGASVNSAADKTLKDLSATIPNPKLGTTTVGDIRRAGDDVIHRPTLNNPYHCEMCGITPQHAERLFTPVVPNPNR